MKRVQLNRLARSATKLRYDKHLAIYNLCCSWTLWLKEQNINSQATLCTGKQRIVTLLHFTISWFSQNQKKVAFCINKCIVLYVNQPGFSCSKALRECLLRLKSIKINKKKFFFMLIKPKKVLFSDQYQCQHVEIPKVWS